jgi:hypothetical protein
MQTNAKQSTVNPITSELINALDIVINLAEGNCLDPTDPDMEDDPDLAEQADQQLGAIDTVNQFLELISPDFWLVGSVDQNYSMNRYELENTVNAIDGYFLPRPHEEGNKGEIEAFNRAKAEVLLHLQRKMAFIQSLSVEKFYEAKRGKIPV